MKTEVDLWCPCGWVVELRPELEVSVDAVAQKPKIELTDSAEPGCGTGLIHPL